MKCAKKSPLPPAIETPSLLCSVPVWREGFIVACGRIALRYSVAKHGMKFPEQFRCSRHASELRKKGFNVKKKGSDAETDAE
jgi:hypothetical protein